MKVLILTLLFILPLRAETNFKCQGSINSELSKYDLGSYLKPASNVDYELVDDKLRYQKGETRLEIKKPYAGYAGVDIKIYTPHPATGIEMAITKSFIQSENGCQVDQVVYREINDGGAASDFGGYVINVDSCKDILSLRNVSSANLSNMILGSRNREKKDICVGENKISLARSMRKRCLAVFGNDRLQPKAQSIESQGDGSSI